MTAAPLELEPVGTSLADRAYVAIRDQLIMLEIRPGEPIDDDELARSLGVGRTPVREALKRLEGDRLVVTYPRRGTFATGMDITDLAHISEIRVQLEPLAARRAAERAPQAVRAELGELATRIEDLDVAALIKILTEPKNALVKQYQKLFDMEDVRLGFTDDALVTVAKKAIERKTGARGLRSILEGILLDTMFDLPSMDGVDEVMIDKDVVAGTKEPVRVYAKKEKAGDAA